MELNVLQIYFQKAAVLMVVLEMKDILYDCNQLCSQIIFFLDSKLQFRSKTKGLVVKS